MLRFFLESILFIKAVGDPKRLHTFKLQLIEFVITIILHFYLSIHTALTEYIYIYTVTEQNN